MAQVDEYSKVDGMAAPVFHHSNPRKGPLTRFPAVDRRIPAGGSGSVTVKRHEVPDACIVERCLSPEIGYRFHEVPRPETADNLQALFSHFMQPALRLENGL